MTIRAGGVVWNFGGSAEFWTICFSGFGCLIWGSVVAGFLALWVGIIYVLVLWVVGFGWFVLVMVCLDFCRLCVFVFDLCGSIIGVVFGGVVLCFVGSLRLLLRFGIDCRLAGSRD